MKSSVGTRFLKSLLSLRTEVTEYTQIVVFLSLALPSEGAMHVMSRNGLLLAIEGKREKEALLTAVTSV